MVSQRGQRQPGVQNEVPGRLKIKAELGAGWLEGRATVSLPSCDRFSHSHKTLESCLCELVRQSQYCAPSPLPKPGSLAVDVPNLA